MTGRRGSRRWVARLSTHAGLREQDLGAAAEDELEDLATDMLRPPLRAATYRTLLGLLAVTGIRVGEAIALDRDDVDLREGRLAIHEAKRHAASASSDAAARITAARPHSRGR